MFYSFANILLFANSERNTYLGRVGYCLLLNFILVSDPTFMLQHIGWIKHNDEVYFILEVGSNILGSEILEVGSDTRMKSTSSLCHKDEAFILVSDSTHVLQHIGWIRHKDDVYK